MFDVYRDILKAMIDSNIDLFLSIIDKIKTSPGVNSQGAILLDILESKARDNLMGQENNSEMIDCVILETTAVLISLDELIEQHSKIKSISAAGCKLFMEDPAGKKNSVNIYPSIIKHLKQQLPKDKNFSKDDVVVLLSAQWKLLFNKTLSEGSVKLYARAYVDHMMEQGDIILINTNNIFLYNSDKNYKLVSPGHNKPDKQKSVESIEKIKEIKPEEPVESKEEPKKIKESKSDGHSVFPIPSLKKPSLPKTNGITAKYGERFKQSIRGSPMQRYIFEWALQHNTDLVDLYDLHKHPINHPFRDASVDKLRDSFLALELNDLAKETSKNIFRLDFEKFLTNSTGSPLPKGGG